MRGASPSRSPAEGSAVVPRLATVPGGQYGAAPPPRGHADLVEAATRHCPEVLLEAAAAMGDGVTWPARTRQESQLGTLPTDCRSHVASTTLAVRDWASSTGSRSHRRSSSTSQRGCPREQPRTRVGAASGLTGGAARPSGNASRPTQPCWPRPRTLRRWAIRHRESHPGRRSPHGTRSPTAHRPALPDRFHLGQRRRP